MHPGHEESRSGAAPRHVRGRAAGEVWLVPAAPPGLPAREPVEPAAADEPAGADPAPEGPVPTAAELSPDALREALPPGISLRAGAGGRERWLLLDTFDRRLARAGGVLRSRRERGSVRLAWRAEEREHTGLAPGPIDFAASLPEGPIRRELAPIVDVRRLLPLIELELFGPRFDLLDRRGKTVVRLRLESARFRDARRRNGIWSALPPALRVTPLRGYEEELGRVLRALAERRALTAVEEPELRAARALHGTGDPARPVAELPPDVSAGEGARRILRALLSQVLANVEGARADLDPEFLHDLRVAVRRARALLGQLKGVFPAEPVERLRAELAWLAGETGPARDLDVLSLDLERLAAAPDAPELEDLRELVRRERAEARARLVAALGSSRHRALVGVWSAFLDEPEEGALGPAARRPLREVLAERLRSLQRRLARRAATVGEGTPPAELHRLRLDAKKLRYLLDGAGALFRAEALASALGPLRRLQDVLGRANDLCVQRATLARSAERLADELASARPERLATSLVGVGRWVERLAREEERLRGRVRRQAERVASSRWRKRFLRLLASDGARP